MEVDSDSGAANANSGQTSDATKWTLEHELCKLADEPNLQEALYRLGLCGTIDRDARVSPEGTWIRGGAETYIFSFQVISRDQPPLKLLLKACTPTVAGRGRLEAILQEWIDRRLVVESSGVSVPHLYFAGSGLVLEEFVQFDLAAVLRSSDDKRLLVRALTQYAGVLQRLGFRNSAPFSDLRSRGSDLVVVDFGSDLGPPLRTGLARDHYFEQLGRWLTQENIPYDYSRLWEAFEIERDSGKQALSAIQFD